jgi:hypothetical protein
MILISSNRAMWDLARGGSIGGRTFLLKDRTTLQHSSIWRRKLLSSEELPTSSAKEASSSEFAGFRGR